MPVYNISNYVAYTEFKRSANNAVAADATNHKVFELYLTYTSVIGRIKLNALNFQTDF